MKLNGKMMVAAAMILGATAALGCNAPASLNDGAVAPEETPATAPVANDGAGQAAQAAGVAEDAFGVYGRFGRFFGARGEVGPHYYAPHAPPAARFENPGRAPSGRHFWSPGYYRWNGREHMWIGGRWEMRRPGFQFVAPHWVHRFGRWEYIPGVWVRL